MAGAIILALFAVTGAYTPKPKHWVAAKKTIGSLAAAAFVTAQPASALDICGVAPTSEACLSTKAASKSAPKANAKEYKELVELKVVKPSPVTVAQTGRIGRQMQFARDRPSLGKPEERQLKVSFGKQSPLIVGIPAKAATVRGKAVFGGYKTLPGERKLFKAPKVRDRLFREVA
mmetsp:Transcript_15087/g.45055  ORF Transcript_15087/g.45055 Transcript_15087/m.45055 type:complete len:175 (-) Transcript_15087:59-583(-)|eukprot:CAMPEP_0119273288 /NCGR_PEP_ID=MMETSP1329-20130426/9967_1 /TAXON_ID=114041 /ORGANISM="Genus nov. species nov., Strain RCC1024" /LENGTH=174 /DNA_ID=CAMNT_0007273477 /DNA_START=145 /DNA_END=669 /DNA_ORIENTATION=+